MTEIETILVFAGIPLLVFSVFALLTLGVGGRRTPRYRPGRPFTFAPVWFTSAARPGGSSGDAAALPGPSRAALESAGETPGAGDIRPATTKGGARGTW
jgi:hypothetical protein